MIFFYAFTFCSFRKNLRDYQADRERSDLGYFVFDLNSDILFDF